MDNPWLALEIGADPAKRSDELRVAHEAFVISGAVRSPVRDVVADSWRRSARLVGPETMAPVDLTDDDLEAYRREHPLARVMPLMREMLGTIAYDGAHVVAVCDSVGRLLWVEGHPAVKRRAEGMNFVAGARWDEVHAGTNAPGTALAVDHAVQIFAAEHFSRRVQRFTCAAAPIHDPATGALLGAVDITGGSHLASPHSLALVQAAARAAEAQLMAERPMPARTTTSLRALGRREAILDVEGARHRLGVRHSEILVLLATEPDGLSTDRLAWLLYGDRFTSPVTLRAEMSRLRQLLGRRLPSRPYRLIEPPSADFLTVAELVRHGWLDAALRAYSGPLLPLSASPGIRALRTQLDDQVRDAVLGSRDHTLLEQWATGSAGEDDLEAWESVANGLPAGSPRQARASARVVDLRRKFGVGPCADPPGSIGEAAGPSRDGRGPAAGARGAIPRPRHPDGLGPAD